MRFEQAIDRAVAEAMEADPRVVIIGEDVHMIRGPLFARFGKKRVLPTPISEGAFVGAGVGAAMAGLRPIVELMMVDFVAVAMDAVLNHMAKVETFSGGTWRCPLVLRAPCGGGYGDGGQHEQALWGMLGGIPGLKVVVPSTPADAAGLMKTAIADDGPVVFLEHKLLSDTWRESLGRGGRETVSYDVPASGVADDEEASAPIDPVPIGAAIRRREGDDLTIVSLAVGVHRGLQAAERLAEARGIQADVIDLRAVRPLDHEAVAESVRRTGRLLVVDEDYRELGLSGEIAAGVLEAGLSPCFERVCLEGTIPYAPRLERNALPSFERIVLAAGRLLEREPAHA